MNLITVLDSNHFQGFPNLNELILSWNPIYLIETSISYFTNENLQSLKIEGVGMNSLSFEFLASFPKLKSIDVSYGRISRIHSLKNFKYLETFKMIGRDILYFPKDVFLGLDKLNFVETGTFKLCCRELLPDQVLDRNCRSPSDELSSCQNLLRSDAYR